MFVKRDRIDEADRRVRHVPCRHGLGRPRWCSAWWPCPGSFGILERRTHRVPLPARPNRDRRDRWSMQIPREPEAARRNQAERVPGVATSVGRRRVWPATPVRGRRSTRATGPPRPRRMLMTAGHAQVWAGIDGGSSGGAFAPRRAFLRGSPGGDEARRRPPGPSLSRAVRTPRGPCGRDCPPPARTELRRSGLRRRGRHRAGTDAASATRVRAMR